MENIKIKIIQFLRWSEKYTHTDMVYLVTGGFWLSLSQVVASATSFLLAIAFANLLPKETFGVYRYIISLFSILAIPTLSGIETSLARAAAMGNEPPLSKIVKTRIRWGTLGGIASAALAIYYYINGNNELAVAFLITAAFIPLTDPLGTYVAYLNGKKKFIDYAKYFVITQTISTAFTLITLFFTKEISFLVLAYFLPQTITNLIFLKITVKKYPQTEKPDTETISYGKHLTLMSVVNSIASQIDRVLVFHYLGAAELAIYAMAIAMPEQIKGFLKSIGTLALPKFSERSPEEIRKTFWDKIIKFTIFLAVITVIYIALCPFVFRWFFPKYMESVIYSQVFAISLVTVANALPAALLKAMKSQNKLYVSNTGEAMIQIALLFPLILVWGLWGVIMARFFTRFLNLGLTLFLVRKF